MDDAKQKDAAKDILERFWTEPVPEATQNFEQGFDDAIRVKEIDSEIARVESMQPRDIDQDEKQRERLAELRAERQRLMSGEAELPGEHGQISREDSYSDYRVIGRDDLLRGLGYKSWSGVRDCCKRYGVEIRHTENGEPYLMNSAVTMLNTKRRRRRK